MKEKDDSMSKYKKRGVQIYNQIGRGKVLTLFFFLTFVAISPVAAFDFDRFSFSLQPKIPTDDGSLSDYSLGACRT